MHGEPDFAAVWAGRIATLHFVVVAAVSAFGVGVLGHGFQLVTIAYRLNRQAIFDSSIGQHFVKVAAMVIVSLHILPNPPVCAEIEAGKHIPIFRVAAVDQEAPTAASPLCDHPRQLLPSFNAAVTRECTAGPAQVNFPIAERMTNY
jgi:hypothetical protein